MHYGGASSSHFNRQLERGCHILVATMGRLKDILDKGRISLSSVRFVVLDEADRMLDMGFLGDIQTVMQHSSMPDVSQRHTFMFSATFPETIQKTRTASLCLSARFVTPTSSRAICPTRKSRRPVFTARGSSVNASRRYMTSRRSG
uniref:ATP-dependent RNA helicase DED1 n=1 Tax=Cacopsylla melanoneura TaxID=428564 RepID=A0A8D8REQ4_9HEMI